MNTPTDLSAVMTPSQLEILARACAGRHFTTVRQFRRDISRFVMWCATAGVDPLRPSATDLDRYRASLDEEPVGQRRWTLDHALRSFVNAGGALTDEHGLGTGGTRTVGAAQVDPGIAYVVQALVDGRQSPRDRAVYRSGANKLLRWAADFDVDPMAIDLVDLEDFRAWIRKVGGSEGETLVIARRFVRLTAENEIRRAVMRARRGLRDNRAQVEAA
jgi:hypothetical protein